VRAQTAPPGPDQYVIIQRIPRQQALHADGSRPTLAEEGWRTIPVPAGKTTDEFLSELRARPDVLSAEPDAQVYAADIPDDPYFRDQVQYLTQIGAPLAWDLETGSNTIVVAVLDSGLDLTHPDFAGRLWENTADASNDGIDHDGNGCINDRYGCRFINYTNARGSICGYTDSQRTGAVMDDDGPPHGDGAGSHGTMVAGVIGAAGNNGIGIAGVAWNVKLMTVKVLDCGTGFGGAPEGYISDVAAGIEYAVRNGARIINLSLASHPDDPTANSPLLRRAIQLAQDYGVIVVAAAGNHPAGGSVAPGYPAAYTEYPNIVAVGASDNLNGNTWAPYSNYGPAIDLAAPGNKIASTVRSDIGWANPYGQVGDATAGYAGGTSFAAPLVTGMFALMLSRNSRLSAQEYVDIANQSATPAAPAPNGQNWAGAGIINLGQAVARVPVSVTGSALRDWRDVAAGTEVRAFIDGNDCGSTTTTSFGVVSHYTIVVKSALQQAGCGAPGKSIKLTIGGQPAFPAFTWGGKNEDLAIVKGGDISTITPSPAGIVVQTLNGGWSNIASFDPTGPAATALSSLPTPWSAAYHWRPDRAAFDGTNGVYEQYIRGAPAAASDWTSVNQFDAFWVDAPAGNVASLNPNPPPGRVLQLQQGWNNFVYTGSSKQVSDALGEVSGRYTEVLQYDNSSKQWQVYIPGQPRYLEDFGGLFKLKTYWIYMSQAGSITMN
jgi:subtilisin family serine protease